MIDSKFEITACLGSIKLKLKDVLNLEKGSVIDLGIPVGTNAKVFYKDRHLFSGNVIVFQQNMGIQIKSYSYCNSEIDKLLIPYFEPKKEATVKKTNVSFSKLNVLSNNDIYYIIKNEHPQTIALISIYLKDLSVLNLFSFEEKTEILIRLSKIKDVNLNLLIALEEIIDKSIDNYFNNSMNISGFDKVVLDLKNLKEEESLEILSKIAELDQNLSQEIKESIKLK